MKNDMKKNIFITGGAGFIGSWITKVLSREGHSITVYDNLSSGLRKNLTGLDGVKFIEGDVLDKRSISLAMAGHDLIFHEAAQLEITTAIEDPKVDVEQNIIGSLNVLQAAKENRIKKLIIASSACVYGQQTNPPVGEHDMTRPNWEYGVSKLAVEKYCDIFADYENMSIANLRYAIVYGEREWYGRVLTIFLKRALEGNSLIIFGDGSATRDFVYVEDVAHFNRLLTKKKWSGNEILNVSTGVATSIVDLAHIVQEVVFEVDGKQIEIIHEDIEEGKESTMVVGRKRLPRELGVMHLKNDKARKFLGWSPSIRIKEGVRREYEWLKKNPDRWTIMSY